MGRVVDYLAALISVGAGGYLLLSQTVAANSYLEVIAHGIGAYFVAKGLFLARSAYLGAAAAASLSSLVALEEWRFGEEQSAQEEPST